MHCMTKKVSRIENIIPFLEFYINKLKLSLIIALVYDFVELKYISKSNMEDKYFIGAFPDAHVYTVFVELQVSQS